MARPGPKGNRRSGLFPSLLRGFQIGIGVHFSTVFVEFFKAVRALA
jgi:hypothetical protein